MSAYGEKTEEQLRVHKIIVQLLNVYHAIYNHKRALHVALECRAALDAFIYDLQASPPIRPVTDVLPDDWVKKSVEALPKAEPVKAKVVSSKKSYLYPKLR